MVLVDTANVYSACTDQRSMDATHEKFYTELLHEMIDNKTDDPPARTTRARRSSTAKNAVLANLELPHLMPTKRYKKRKKWGNNILC